jgi:hypothetical protein
MWSCGPTVVLCCSFRLCKQQTANSKQRPYGTVTNYRNYNRNYKDTLAPGHVPSLLNVFVVAKDAEILRQKGRIDAEYKGGEGIALFCVCVCVRAIVQTIRPNCNFLAVAQHL